MNYITPLTIGIVGSMHCIGMCGPIALALPLSKNSSFKRTSGLLLYNFGRVSTYALLGTLFGFLGKSFYIGGFQRQFSIFLGVMILIGLFIPHALAQKSKLSGLWYKVFGNLYKEMAQLLKNGSFQSLFVIGLINGFLPCGLVYLALAGSLAQISVSEGALFMILFGLGTIPAMFSIGWIGKYITLKMRNRIKKASPYFIALFGILLILRGLNLGVFLSPRIDAVGAFIQSCI